jgi:MFS family permease
MTMTSETTANVGQGPLDASPMTRAQVVVVGVAVLLAALDGYDVLGMAFVAPAVSHAWHLQRAVIGLLLSTSLMGMAFGSIVLSPFADITGRKPLVFGGIVLMVIGSFLSALSHTVPQLAACRILTGVGIGVMVPLTTTLASEFASAKGRSFAVAASTTGFAAGSALGGLVAATLLKQHAWPSVFFSGAVVGVLLLPVVAFGLPESPVFLISRRTPNALERLNGVLSRLGRSVLTVMPEVPPAKRTSYAALFTSEMIGVTLTYAAVMMLVSTATYYLLNWMPQMIADAGFSPAQGSMVSAMPSMIGLVAGLLWGLAANRFGPARLAAISATGLGCAMILFGFTPPVLGLLAAAAGVCGIFAGGSASLFYAAMAAYFPPLVRVSGIGFVIGLGRVVSVAGPAVAGVLFSAGLTRSSVSLIFACLPIVAGILLYFASRAKPVLVVPSAQGA